MDGLYGRDPMAEFEKMLFERNNDDWLVSDASLSYIGVKEYRMYELECDEVLMEDAE